MATRWVSIALGTHSHLLGGQTSPKSHLPLRLLGTVAQTCIKRMEVMWETEALGLSSLWSFSPSVLYFILRSVCSMYEVSFS